MTSAGEFRHIRRILVALDASTASLAALESAAALAARLEAELRGLFVEDINLVRLAGLPFAREISYVRGLARRIEAQDVERAMRIRARLAQEAFAQVSARLSLRSSFRIVRGQVVAELLSAASQADLLALGIGSVGPVPRRRPGVTAHAVALGAVTPVLFLPPGGGMRTPVTVIFDGTPAATHALALAADIAGAEPGALAVWLSESEGEAGDRLREQAGAALDRAGISARFETLVALDPADVAERVRRERPATLLLPAASPLASREHLAMLFDAMRGAVLLVR